MPQHSFVSALTEVNGLRFQHGVGGRVTAAFGSGVDCGGEVTVDGFKLYEAYGERVNFIYTNLAHVDNFSMES